MRTKLLIGAMLAGVLSPCAAMSQPQALSGIRGTAAEQMSACDAAFENLRLAINGAPSPANLRALGTVIQTECARAEEALVELDDFPGNTFAARDAVRMWLVALRQIPDYRKLSTGLVERYARFSIEREWANANGKRLANEALGNLREVVAADKNRQSLAADMWDSAVQALAAEASKGPAAIKPATPTQKRAVQDFEKRGATLLISCKADFDRLKKAPLQTVADAAFLAGIERVISRCEKAEEALEKLNAPRVPSEAADRLETWTGINARAARSFYQAARALKDFAVDRRPNDLASFRASTVAARATETSAREQLREAMRLIGIKR